MGFTRYGVYFLPEDGPLAAFGAAWLGWDVARACAVRHLDVPGLAAVTERPRRYGFHATLKPPFRLADPKGAAALDAAMRRLAARCAPAEIAALEVTPLGRFLALTVVGDSGGAGRVAAAAVRDLDHLRAAPTSEDLERRRAHRLTARQEAMLARWGYPHVMDEFRFHMTLTGPLPKAEVAGWTDRARAALPLLPNPVRLDQVALVGERAADGRFQLIRRYPLSGPEGAKGSAG